MGAYLYDQLQTLYEHPIVGDVRGGLGLLCGIELVKDRTTRERFPTEVGLGRKITAAFLRHGLLARQRGDIIFLIPPLIVTRKEIDYVVGQVDKVLSDVESELV